MADSKISGLAAVTDLLTTDEYVLARSSASKKITGASLKAAMPGIGSTILVYRYTVTGADKASIDTGVDAADAGSNDWTDGDLLEVYIAARTDLVAAQDVIDVTVNNDTGAKYDRQRLTAVNATVAAAANVADSKWQMDVHGASGSSGYPAAIRFAIPDFAGTVFWKSGEQANGVPDGTAANEIVAARAIGFRDTAAITRLKIAATGTSKLKVGSQLLIYKRKAS